MVTNPHNEVTTFAYDAVGNRTTLTRANVVHRDSDPALYFMQARYYAADIGRFITMDAWRGILREPLSLHRYLYASNRPTTRVDPTGYSSSKECKDVRLHKCLERCFDSYEETSYYCSVIGVIFGVTCIVVCAVSCTGTTLGWLLCFAKCQSTCGQVATAAEAACLLVALVAYMLCTSGCYRRYG